MTQAPLWIVSGLVMVGVLVILHEAGHFLAARLFGVGTPIFSIGLGPRLFGFRAWETDFRVSLLPIGGYVLLSGADPFGEEDPDSVVDPSRDFMRKPVWQRLIIMAAGPGMNLALPFVLFTIVLMFGEPTDDNVVGTVYPNTVAAKAGLAQGDEIVRVAGEPTEVWDDVLWALSDSAGETGGAPIPIEVSRAGRPVSLALPAEDVVFTANQRVDTERMGFTEDVRSSRIGVSDTTSPAWKAGLRPLDAIVSVDGVALERWDALSAALAEERPHTIERMRWKDGAVDRATLTLTPDPLWQPAPEETSPDRWGIVHSDVFAWSLEPGSAAEAAGVLPGDRLVAIDGNPVATWWDVLARVRETVDDTGPEVVPRELTLDVIREGARHSLRFRPTIEREVVPGAVVWRPLMGIGRAGDAFVSGVIVRKYYGPLEASARAVDEGGAVLRDTLSALWNLVAFKAPLNESLGGPIEIFRAAGKSAEVGIFAYVRMMGLISFSLGIINLLPVPVLDGGQILFYTIEGIRGRPLPLSLRERIQMIGVLALTALFLTVMVLDVSRLLEG
jgi:regulator of sigma E protease